MARLAMVGMLFQLCSVSGSAAQEAPAPSGPTHRYHTLSVGTTDETPVVSYRWVGIWDGRGLDASLTVLPEALAYGGVVLGGSLGPTLWLPGEDVRPFVKAGAGALAAAVDDVRGVVALYYFGAGLLIMGESGKGVRLDWTRYGHGDGELVSTLELGFSWTVGTSR